MKKSENTETATPDQPKIISIIELQSLAYEHAQEIDRLTNIYRQIQATIVQRKTEQQNAVYEDLQTNNTK